ncbi:MAG: hypothetical protein HC803_00580 [Saprospiraceae bacterium]|nr:hypothetical protein [Saprospiraceae bacterium]
MVIGSDNNLITGIAAKNTTQLDYKLFVEDGIRTERVTVDVQGDWFDYVFEPDYELPTLEEVEQFIQKNNHLPDFPSEKDVRANGIDVAEMDGLLLKKIEELTLYTIEQQKLLGELRKQNELLLKRVEQLEKE